MRLGRRSRVPKVGLYTPGVNKLFAPNQFKYIRCEGLYSYGGRRFAVRLEKCRDI